MISMFMLGGRANRPDPKPELMKYDGKTFSGDVKFDNPAQASREIMALWKSGHTANAAWSRPSWCHIWARWLTKSR